MAQTEDYDIVGSYNNQRILEIDAERSVNLFQYIDPLAKKPKSLIYTSGLTNSNFVFSGASGGFRSQFTFNNFTYLVIGQRVYSVSNLNIVAFLGTINTSTGFVNITANTFQIIFVDGLNGWIWDTNALTFTQIKDQSFPSNPIDVTFLDGFFIVADGGTNGFQLSSFNQGMVWGPAANNFTTNFAVNSRLMIGASTIGGLSGTQNYSTGIPVQVSNSGGSLPSPLLTGITYYVIQIDSTHIELATTYTNSINGVFITLTSDGSGTQTITSLGQLQEGFITTHPGNIVACRTLHRRLFLFSNNFTEVWENQGIGTNLPFRRNNSLLMEFGTPAIGSIAVSFDVMYFLSQSVDGLGAVMKVEGTQSEPVSTRAIDFQFSTYAAVNQVSDCRAFLIKENGLIFYRMNFTAANHTFIYNHSLSNPESEPTKLWHEEEVLNGNRHLAQTHAYFNGLNYVGDYLSPILYIVDNSNFTNNGEPIRRMRIGRPLTPPGYNRTRIDRLHLDLLQGDLSQGQDQPLVFLSISKDGGKTYGNILKSPMGKVGQNTFRTVWRKLGTIPRGQSFIPKIEFYDEVPFIILGAAWTFEVMPE